MTAFVDAGMRRKTAIATTPVRSSAAAGGTDVTAIKVGFLMDQIAGHITNYRNLRSVAERDADIVPTWRELHYYRDGGVFERMRARFPRIPQYLTGVARGTLELDRGLRHHDYDVVLTNASVALLRRRALDRTPWIYDFDSTPMQRDEMEAYTAHSDPAPVARLKKKLTRDLFNSATVLQAWSNWAKRSVVDDYGIPADKVLVNPPGVDLSFWHPPAAPRPAQPRPRRVLFVGGDFARKGGNQLLEWHRHQAAADVELHLVTRESVEARPGVCVHHNMHPNTPELLALFHHCDVFVLPSLGECFGIATVEAMATGLPVVVTDVGGTADIVEPGRNGYLVAAGAMHELSAALDAILGDDTRRQQMGTEARRIAESRFDLEANARRTLAELKRIAATPRLR